MVYTGTEGPKALNTAGQKGEDTFFLIDYEKKSWFVAPLNQISSWGIQYEIGPSPVKSGQKIPKIEKVLPPAPEEYKRAFEYVQDQQRSGNSFLCNLTFPSSIVLESDGLDDLFGVAQAPFKLLVTDTRISPLPYLVFTPEPFLTSDGAWLLSSPMKGTRYFENTKEEAHSLELLLNDPKEQAEHRTIVDLIRNDLGIICEQVQVNSYRYPEKIPLNRGTLWATSSEITGKPPKNWQSNLGTILDAMLPAGSITGAPKRETCRIIEKVEPDSRGFYTGVAGILGSGKLQSWVLIRFIEGNPGNFRFRSGGGITMYSDLDTEYQELIAKIGIPSGK